MVIKGKVWKFGDDIDTDIIIPATYLNSTDPTFLGRHCLEPVRPDFSRRVRPGDIVVAGRNFGCGSSREHAPLALKGCRVAAVVAASFARIFFRNAINIGLPVVESPELARKLKNGDRVRIDLDRGLITVIGTGHTAEIAPFPDFLQAIIAAGGLMRYQQKRIRTSRGR